MQQTLAQSQGERKIQTFLVLRPSKVGSYFINRVKYGEISNKNV